ncbi:unnamed protein product [Phaedon cochleariae]|uniref:Uncharacterized protein n=1 Tax=Phaedon cochleariae TaxID=80249 RepID=A0A9N9X558_PHACE|nr:unnamed protein product [Phaedon cochleariae]
MALFNKATVILLIVAFAMVISTTEASVRVGPCDQATFILLIVAFAMVISTTEASVRVGPCDQVCSRINPEKDECCRAHGYSSHAHCRGGMHCN